MATVDVIVGGFFGDEGKGKLVGAIGQDYDAVLRVNASTNAGHCVSDGVQTYVTRQLPSVFFPKKTQLVLAPGALLNLPALAAELASRPDADQLRGRLAVASSIALVIPPYIQKGQTGTSLLLGSTHQGAGPSAVARAARHALHLYDVSAVVSGREGAVEAVREQLIRTTRETLPDRPEAWTAQEIDRLLEEQVTAFRSLEARVGVFCVDYTSLCATTLRQASRLLIEGCNGLLLDNLHGSHPNVTSTSTNLGAMLCGANLSPQQVNRTIVVLAAYATCLGPRVFPTEVSEAEAGHFFDRCNEVDVAQSQRRRIGWLDLPGVRKALVGAEGAVLHLNKLDVLSGLRELKVCTQYRLDGELLDLRPDDPRRLAGVAPVYRTLPGWTRPLADVRRFAELPAEARGFVDFLQEQLPNRVVSLGLGPRNQDILYLEARP